MKRQNGGENMIASACNKMIQQYGPTCFYYSVLNGLLTSPRINRILARELISYKEEIRYNKELYDDFLNKDNNTCLAPSIIKEIVDKPEQTKYERFKAAKNIIMKYIKNHFESIMMFSGKTFYEIANRADNNQLTDSNFKLNEAMLPKLTLYTTKTKDIQSVKVSGVPFVALKAMFHSIFSDNETYRKHVLVLPFHPHDEYTTLEDVKEQKTFIQNAISKSNHSIIVLIKSEKYHTSSDFFVYSVYAYFRDKGLEDKGNFLDFFFGAQLKEDIKNSFNGKKPISSKQLEDEIQQLKRLKIPLDNILAFIDIFRTKHKEEIIRPEKYEYAAYYKINNNGSNKYFNEQYKNEIVEITYNKYKNFFYYYGLPSYFTFNEWKPYDNLFKDSRFELDHSNVVAGEGGAFHAILGTKCDGKYVMIDQNRPTEILNNDWSKSLTNIDYNYYGFGYAYDSPKVKLDGMFSFVVYVNKAVQPFKL
jgi:hypothetical protein